MNLHDAAALERLPQLTPNKKSREVESPVSQDAQATDLRTSTSRNKDSQSHFAVNPDQWRKNKSELSKSVSVTPDFKEQEVLPRSRKHRNVPESREEDLVVLSFSSSAG